MVFLSANNPLTTWKYVLYLQVQVGTRDIDSVSIEVSATSLYSTT